ncbi:hypothetical protein GQ53DRAFT_669615, partial [Thozetella sp. PMI_491]
EMPSRRVPADQRKRTEISCDRCKHRKQKCHKPPDAPSCRYCETHGFDCVTSQRPKARIYSSADAVTARINLLESLVKGLMPEADTSSLESMRALGSSLGIPLPAPDAAPPPPAASISTQPPADQPYEMPVLRDQQGQTQYIGPASSYLFQIKLRALFGGPGQNGQTPGQFFLFGRNPTEKAWVAEVSSFSREIMPSPSNVASSSTPASDGFSAGAGDVGAAGSPIDSIIASHVPDTLITAYFEHVHADFPVLHESSFREEYERHAQSPNLLASTADPTWICSLLCVLILARRSQGGLDVLSLEHGQEAEERWWRKVQALLPSVIFTSSISAVQALLLMGLHLHNNNHRDSCWTLTGAAARIAFAIGLHRDTIIGNNKKPMHNPVTRELRKRLWWTLYTFEMMQASSLDRPSAVDETLCTSGCPRESILGSGGGGGDACVLASSRLVVMLSQACRVVRGLTTGGSFCVRPLSPAASLLRDMDRWKDQLPSHLRLDAADALTPTGQRAIFLMHSLYHYILIVMSRNALLALAAKHAAAEAAPETAKPCETVLPPPHPASASRPSPVLSDICTGSAQETIRILLRLDAIGRFDPVSWWDMYYLYTAALVLVLSVICETKRFRGYEAAQRQSQWIAESLRLLDASSELASRQLKHPLIPGTMHRYAIVISDLNLMTLDFVAGRPPRSSLSAQNSIKQEPRSDAVMLVTSPAPTAMDQQAYLFSAGGDFEQGRPPIPDLAFGQDNMMGYNGLSLGFGFPDTVWAWQDGAQWNNAAGMLLGAEFGQQPPPL